MPRPEQRGVQVVGHEGGCERQPYHPLGTVACRWAIRIYPRRTASGQHRATAMEGRAFKIRIKYEPFVQFWHIINRIGEHPLQDVMWLKTRP